MVGRKRGQTFPSLFDKYKAEESVPAAFYRVVDVMKMTVLWFRPALIYFRHFYRYIRIYVRRWKRKLEVTVRPSRGNEVVLRTEKTEQRRKNIADTFRNLKNEKSNQDTRRADVLNIFKRLRVYVARIREETCESLCVQSRIK